jgi:protein-disulfide isomerase
MHDALFKQPLALDVASLKAKAQDLKLDETKLSGCLSNTAEGLVRQDVSLANSLHVQYTPSFFFGVRVGQDQFRVLNTLSGFQSLPAFKKILQETEAQINVANCGVLARLFGNCKVT